MVTDTDASSDDAQSSPSSAHSRRRRVEEEDFATRPAQLGSTVIPSRLEAQWDVGEAATYLRILSILYDVYLTNRLDYAMGKRYDKWPGLVAVRDEYYDQVKEHLFLADAARLEGEQPKFWLRQWLDARRAGNRGRLRAYITTIALNYYRTLLNRRVREVGAVDFEDMEPFVAAPSPLTVARQDKQTILDMSLRDFQRECEGHYGPESPQWRCFELYTRRAGATTYAKVAGELGMKAGTVGFYMNGAHRRMAELVWNNLFALNGDVAAADEEMLGIFGFLPAVRNNAGIPLPTQA